MTRGRLHTMCGRYELVDGQRVFIRFRVTNTVPPILDHGDVRPTQQVFALQNEEVYGVTAARAAAPVLQSLVGYRAPGT